MTKESTTLSKFPKRRSLLPADYQKIHHDAYTSNRNGETLFTKVALWLEKWMHKKVSADPRSDPLLEIGAGTLNHVNHESDVDIYDIVEPFSDLYKDSENLYRIRDIYETTDKILLIDYYKRIVSIAAFEHIENLPDVVASTALLLSEDGELRVGIPTEGGILWYLAWRLGTGFGFWLKYKLSYKVLMKHEHINNEQEIIDIISLFYDRIEVQRFPFACKHLSFYTYILAREPKKMIAKAHLKNE